MHPRDLPQVLITTSIDAMILSCYRPHLVPPPHILLVCPALRAMRATTRNTVARMRTASRSLGSMNSLYGGHTAVCAATRYSRWPQPML